MENRNAFTQSTTKTTTSATGMKERMAEMTAPTRDRRCARHIFTQVMASVTLVAQ